MAARRARGRAPVGKELAKIRIDHDETVGYMAERVRVHAVHLSKVESGMAAFSAALAAKVKEVYGVDLSHMINEAIVEKITFNMSKLSPEDRATILEIQARTPGMRKKPNKQESPEAAVNQTRPIGVPDVDGVDFLDDTSSLDELD